jgi:hypothetical protein
MHQIKAFGWLFSYFPTFNSADAKAQIGRVRHRQRGRKK